VGGRRRRGDEVLLERLQVEGIGRRGREVGSLEWRGRRGGGGVEGRVNGGEVKGRLGEACGEKPCEDGRGVGGCLDPDLDTSGKHAMSLVASPVVLHSSPSLSRCSFSRRHARKKESVFPL